MDSEQRHELQENDLQHFLFHFNEWWKKNGTLMLLAILILVAAVTGWRWYLGKDASEREAAWTDLAGTSSPDGLKEIARRYADRPGLAGYAMLRASDQLGEQAMDTAATDNADGQKSQDEIKRLMDGSITLAQQTIDAPQAPGLAISGEPSLMKLNARLRLAANYETTAQWDLAKAQYEAVRKEAGPYKTLATLADLRLSRIAAIEQPVTLPQAPPKPKADPTSATPQKPDAPAPDAPDAAAQPAAAPETQTPPTPAAP
ncbi:MAG: YfgM family protein [Phycisphaerales bacterium]